MKKFASSLLTAVMLAVVMTVFAVPAFAEDAPVEVRPGDWGVLSTAGNYIISKDCTVETIDIGNPVTKNVTLTIAEGVTVTVTGDMINHGGTVNVLGTLEISDSARNVNNFGTINVFDCGAVNVHCTMNTQDMNNNGTVNVFGTLHAQDMNNNGTVRVLACGGGNIMGTPSGNGTVSRQNEHVFVDGVCACGEIESTAAGSVLSEGSIWIVIAVAVVAIGGVAALVIGKKKAMHNS